MPTTTSISGILSADDVITSLPVSVAVDLFPAVIVLRFIWQFTGENVAYEPVNFTYFSRVHPVSTNRRKDAEQSFLASGSS